MEFHPDQSAASLLRWIAAWLEDHQRRRAANFAAEHEQALVDALSWLRGLLPDPSPAAPAPSLADFRERFLPLQIVVGDRREIVRNRLTMADLFILSMASSD